MEKLRKFLEITFALLSIFFAAIALHRCFYDSNTDWKKYPPLPPAKENLQWGSQLVQEARRTTRLVLFKVTDDNKNPDFAKDIFKAENDKDLKELLNDNYIQVALNAKAWPADFAVLDSLLKTNAKDSANLDVGILSTRMRPIYLSRKANLVDTPSSPCLRTLLFGAAHQYRNNKLGILKESQNSVRLIYNPENFRAVAIEAPYVPRMSFLNAESLALFAFFTNPANDNAPAGVFAENARLATRISVIDMRQTTAQHAAALAVKKMLKQLNAPESDFSRRLQMARALAEYGVLKKNKHVIENLEKFAEELFSKCKDGLLSKDGEPPMVRYNAIYVGFLTRMYFNTKNEKYLLAAQKCADMLCKNLEPYGEMPAIADASEPSQSSSVEYALLARALCDIHYATGEEKYLKMTKRCLEEWSEFYMTPLGIWSINSENSPTSEYARPIILDDDSYPAYVGLAAQVLAYLDKIDPDYELPNEAKIKRIAASAFTFSMLTRQSTASYKLSFFMFANPRAKSADIAPKIYYENDANKLDKDKKPNENDLTGNDKFPKVF